MVLDWLKQMQVKTSLVRDSKENRRKFYEKMKNNIAQDSDIVVPISNFVEGINKKESMGNSVLFGKMILKCNSGVIETYCKLGVELGNLKFCTMLIFAPLVAAVQINMWYWFARNAHKCYRH